MKQTTVGVLLLVIILVGAIVAIRFGWQHFQQQEEARTSDKERIKGKIRMRGDNWLGYFIFHSPRFTQNMRTRGYAIDWLDDAADYPARMRALSKNECDIIVCTVDSYVLNAYPFNYPGSVFAVIDESKGADAFIGKEAIGSIEGLNEPNIRIALTPHSPSEFLLKAVAAHFALDNIRQKGPWFIETNGSQEALRKLKLGRADAAGLWEPDVSSALALPGMKKIIGTDQTQRLIVDILVVNRDYLNDNPAVVELFLREYFLALSYYGQNRTELVKYIKKKTKKSASQIDKMLAGVEWVDLENNCEKWFGIAAPGIDSEEGIIDTIESIAQIFGEVGDFDSDPLQGNPYTITYSGVLERLYTKTAPGDISDVFAAASSGNRDENSEFSTLSSKRWNSLEPVGRIKIRPIVFMSGTATLTTDGKNTIDEIVERQIIHYPRFRIRIKGHTAPGSDEKANLLLSQERAESVLRYIATVYQIDPDRVQAVGVGSKEPLPRLPGESPRRYKYRLPRVEFVLLESTDNL